MNNPYSQCPKCDDLESFWRAEAELLRLEQDSDMINEENNTQEPKNNDIPTNTRRPTTN